MREDLKQLWKTVRRWWHLNVYTYTKNYVKTKEREFTTRIGWVSPDGGAWIILRQRTFRWFNRKYILTVEENQN